jgi:hypothetical protein
MAYKRKAIKRKRTKRPIRRRKMSKRSTFAKRVKRVVMKTSEIKKAPVTWSKIELNHNSMPYSSLLHLNQNALMSAVGAGQAQRIGDRINTIGWRIRMLIGQKGDRPNVNFRWVCFSVPKGNIGPVTGAGLPYASIFETVTNNTMLDEVNKDICRVLGQGWMRPNQAGLTATGNDEFTFTKRLYISHKKLYKFGPADGALSHNQHDVFFTVLAYDAFGSLTTDNIAYYQTFSEIHYKDV